MRIAHISDFHLRHNLAGTSAAASRRSRQMPELLEEALSLIESRQPDLVAITGDLTDHPLEVDALDHPDSLRGGRADLRLIGDLLATFSCPWFVLPGNHDHPGLFAEVFGGRPQDTQVAGLRVLAFHDWEGEHHVPQRVGVERRRFDDALDDGDGRRQIHLQHYLIAPDRNEGYPHTYGEGEALRRRIVADGRVAAVLSGHYHAGVDPFRDGDTWFVTAPAFCEAPHPFWLHELDGEGDMHSERVDLR